MGPPVIENEKEEKDSRSQGLVRKRRTDSLGTTELVVFWLWKNLFLIVLGCFNLRYHINADTSMPTGWDALTSYGTKPFGIIDEDLKHSVALIAFSGKRDYAQVKDMTNAEVASIHNAYLEEKRSTFNHLVVNHNSGSRANKFKYKLEPCCESFDQRMENGGKAQYTVCSKPDRHFYWDDINPTHAGWKAVMEELEESIENFLDISSS
ncbi:hypothetical protein SETIT_2G361000v2 [Setaria italica]|uniref:Uncharacterized protein n=1 Tax=Setaria italica TaxID=4555 RepID=A0A368Q6L2_SETIT|nr:hypothetical protein SETIT_2G361000v2 [Setaria italica]